MKALVTGATGHLGNNLTRALLERGFAVRALVRPGSPTTSIAGLDVEITEGDLNDPASLERATMGVDALFHTAAMISIRSGDRDALMRANVEGTRCLMQAARKSGVKKVVHTSSFGAVGTPASGRASTEEDFLDPFAEVMDYERSKAQAEIAVFQEAARGLDVCIVNPSAIVGPHDYGPSLVGKTFLDFGRGKMRAYIPGAFDWVPMRDVVAGQLLALEKGGRGERYLLTGQVHSLDEILSWLSVHTGKPMPLVRIPTAVMQSIAVFKDWIERRFFPSSTPRFNQHSIRILSSGKHGSNAKAQRELGLVPTSPEVAIFEAISWFQSTGRLPAPVLPKQLAAAAAPRLP